MIISKLDWAEGPAGSRYSHLVPSAPQLPCFSTGRWSPGPLHMTWAAAHGLGFSQQGGHSLRQGELASKSREQSCLAAEASTKSQHSVPLSCSITQCRHRPTQGKRGGDIDPPPNGSIHVPWHWHVGWDIGPSLESALCGNICIELPLCLLRSKANQQS